MREVKIEWIGLRSKQMKACDRCGIEEESADGLLRCQVRLYVFDTEVAEGDFEVFLCRECRRSVFAVAHAAATEFLRSSSMVQ
jgi:hypothetical protein